MSAPSTVHAACPLSLHSLPAPSTERHVAYASLLALDPATTDGPLPLDTLTALRHDLSAMAGDNAARQKTLREEVGKLDTFIRTAPPDEDLLMASTAAHSGTSGAGGGTVSGVMAGGGDDRVKEYVRSHL